MKFNKIDRTLSNRSQIQRMPGTHVSELIHGLRVKLGMEKESEIDEHIRAIMEVGFYWEEALEYVFGTQFADRPFEIGVRLDGDTIHCMHCCMEPRYVEGVHYYELPSKEIKCLSETLPCDKFVGSVTRCPLCGNDLPDEPTDYVWGSPDGVDYTTTNLHEYKWTAMSSQKGPLDNDKWLMQVQAYLYMLGWNKVEFTIAHSKGNYRDWRGLMVNYWEGEFTDVELSDNWASLMNYWRSTQ